MSLPIIIRPFQESDRKFVVSSWIQTFKQGHVASTLHYWTLKMYAPLVEPDRDNPSMYMFLQGKLVNHLLDTATTVVACYAEDPDLILGFACGDPNKKLYHYVVVKSEYKLQGIGTALCKALRSFNSDYGWEPDRFVQDMSVVCRKMWEVKRP